MQPQPLYAQDRRSIIYSTPDWVMEFVNLWVKRLGITDTITVEIIRASEPIDVNAECRQFADTNHARISICVDVQENDEWKINILHELIHVKHMRIDHFLTEVVLPETGSLTEHALTRAYKQYYESFVDGTATALYNAFKAVEEAAQPKSKRRPKK